jgi:hypothetical protein
MPLGGLLEDRAQNELIMLSEVQLLTFAVVYAVWGPYDHFYLNPRYSCQYQALFLAHIAGMSEIVM